MRIRDVKTRALRGGRRRRRHNLLAACRAILKHVSVVLDRHRLLLDLDNMLGRRFWTRSSRLAEERELWRLPGRG